MEPEKEASSVGDEVLAREAGKEAEVAREASGSAPPQVIVDQAKVRELIAEIRARQRLTTGVVGGAVAAVVGAIIWAVVTIATDVQVGWMAVGIGFLVGGAVRVLGRGVDNTFGYVGAALSLFGCLLGNLLSVYAIIAEQEELAFFFVLTHVNPAAIPELLAATFHPMDLLFYAIAIYEGYRFSFRRITRTDLMRVATGSARS